MTTEERITGRRPSDNIAQSVRRTRKAQRLPLTEVSRQLTKLGQPIPVLGLRRLEAGERKVDVDELIAIAQVLNVTPLRLIFPVETVSLTEVLPGSVTDSGAAAAWFTGLKSEGPKDRLRWAVHVTDLAQELVKELAKLPNHVLD